MAANALLSGGRVVWIDTSHPFPASRLVSMISAHAQPEEDPLSYLSHLQILHAPSLAHLLALVIHPVSSFPPERTALVVIDNIATPFTAAYLPGHEDFNRKNTDRPQNPSGGGTASPRSKGSPSHKAAPPRDTASTRKFAIMADFMKSLGALATKRGLAVLVLNQMTTKVIPGSGAVLQPAVASPLWVLGLTSRLLVHRNDISSSALSDPSSTPISQIRFVTVLKANGIPHDPENNMKNAPNAHIVVLQIQDGGIDDVGLVRKSRDGTPPASAPASMSTPAPAPAHTATVNLRANTFPPSPVAPAPKRSPALPPLEPRERSPVHKKRKRGLEAGVIAGSEGEDSDEEWESGLDDGGLGAELPTPEEGALGGVMKPMTGG